jgi:hypothetical protein
MATFLPRWQQFCRDGKSLFRGGEVLPRWRKFCRGATIFGEMQTSVAEIVRTHCGVTKNNAEIAKFGRDGTSYAEVTENVPRRQQFCRDGKVLRMWIQFCRDGNSFAEMATILPRRQKFCRGGNSLAEIARCCRGGSSFCRDATSFAEVLKSVAEVANTLREIMKTVVEIAKCCRGGNSLAETANNFAERCHSEQSRVPCSIHFYKPLLLGEAEHMHFTCYPYSWRAIGIHFQMVFLQLAGYLYVFGHGVPIAGAQPSYIFIRYSYSWGAICMHVYTVFL